MSPDDNGGPTLNVCRFCQRPNENNPSDHYHYHACWAKDVQRRIDDAARYGVSRAEMDRLERELEQARYVGD